jgi:hypothetical protein
MSENNPNASPMLIVRYEEQLRQEREIFDQVKRQDERWFLLRLAMGYTSVVLLPSVMCVASYILVNGDKFAQPVVASAGAALFVDVLGLLIAVWKIVINPASMTKLAPVTTIDLQALTKSSNSLLTDANHEHRPDNGVLAGK